MVCGERPSAAGLGSLRGENAHPLFEGKDELKEIPRAQRLLHRPGLMALFTKPVQGDKILRDEAIWKAYLDYGYSMEAIARHAGVHNSTASKVIKGGR
jgi:putative transposase